MVSNRFGTRGCSEGWPCWQQSQKELRPQSTSPSCRWCLHTRCSVTYSSCKWFLHSLAASSLKGPFASCPEGFTWPQGSLLSLHTRQPRHAGLKRGRTRFGSEGQKYCVHKPALYASPEPVRAASYTAQRSSATRPQVPTAVRRL